MSAPRLLIVTTVPGTLTHFLAPYGRYLKAQGWRVDAATGAFADAPGDGMEQSFDRVWEVPWARDVEDYRNWSSAPRTLRRILRAERYDVIHTHTPIASLVTRLVVGSLPLKARPAVCYTAHGFHFHPRGGRAANSAFRAAERLAGRWTDRLVVLNAHDLDAVRAFHLVSPDKVVLVPGVGIDLDHYQPTPELLDAARAVRVQLGIDSSRPLYTSLAELQPGKDHLTLVRALAADPQLDAVLVCAGSGPEESRILAEAARLGVVGRVRMLGSVDDVRPLVLASDAMVLASHREGLSRAVLESIALGVPVIGSRVRGIADLVDVPEAGLLVEPGDVAGFAAAMRSVRAFPEPSVVRKQLEEHLQRYSLPSILAVHARIYDELLAARSAS